MPNLRRCERCGRESWKAVADLKRDYGWTEILVGTQWIFTCGSCQPTKPEAVQTAGDA